MKKLINVKESTRYPGLFVMKYDRKVFYKNLWNTDEDLMEARGHVLDGQGVVVIRPFTKIFNFGENNTIIHRDDECIAIRKVNGFMAAATYVPKVGKVVVSTTGSLDSDFVKMAEEYINEKFKGFLRDSFIHEGRTVTYMFEIVHPNDPHIVKEKIGAYLIGYRMVDDDSPYSTDAIKEHTLDFIARECGFLRPEWKTAIFGDIMIEAKSCQHEGFVVYSLDSGVALKIKSPYYLVLKAVARRKDILTLDKKRVDEEFFGLIDHIKENAESFNLLTEQERITYMEGYIKDNHLR